MTKAPILLNDFKRQWREIGPDVLRATEAVGESGWYVLGREVERCETTLARVFERPYAIGCANGLDAIEISLRALGLRPGERVLTTPLSAFATTLAIVRAGGVPVFVDVDDCGLIDLARCQRAFAADSSLRFFAPVHLYGHALDLPELERQLRTFDLRVVEDCAQSILATSHGRAAGTVGQLAATSFYPTKNLGALGDGGAVLTADAGLRDNCKSLRNYGQSARYVHDRLGLNSRLDELHAAILDRALLPRLGPWTARRKAIALRYLAGIANPHVTTLPAPAGSDSAWHLFPVLVAPEQRDAFKAHLESHNVQSAIHYPTLLPDQAALAPGSCVILDDLTNARRFASGEVSLPIHPQLDNAEVEVVIDAVNEWSPS